MCRLSGGLFFDGLHFGYHVVKNMCVKNGIGNCTVGIADQ